MLAGGFPPPFDLVVDALVRRVFGDRTMADVTHPGLATVITATDLRTTKAVRFGSLRSSCSAYGIIQEPVRVAEESAKLCGATCS